MTGDVVSPGGVILEHDPERQARIVQMYAHGRSENRAARDLLKIARERTMPGPIVLPPGRSLRGEFIEEVADGINYAPWAAFNGEITEKRAARACAHMWAAFALMR